MIHSLRKSDTYERLVSRKKKEIENMTFDQAKEIVEKQIQLGKEGGQWCPREHTTHAYEMILKRAVLYEKFVSAYTAFLKEEGYL